MVKRKPMSEETKIKIGLANRGKKRPNISKALQNRVLSQETRQKIRLSKLGTHQSLETIKNNRLNLIEVYD